MSALTLIIAFAACVITFMTKGVRWLLVYIAVLIYYPSYLTVKLGTIDFTVTRIVIIAIYLNILFRSDFPKRFKCAFVDVMVVLFMVCKFIAGTMTVPFMKLLENHAGGAFDLVLPYFAARLILINHEDFLYFLKGIIILSIPLAFVGIVQTTTGYNPYEFFHKYHAWTDFTYPRHERLGLYRAYVSFSHSILFGMYFAILAPCCLGLWYYFKNNRVAIGCGIGIMLLGMLSSVSSGPWFAGFTAAFVICLFPVRRYWAILFTILVLGCILVEILSNRHFYEVPSRFTLSSKTAYDRIRLMEEAFGGGMDGHWIQGYGLVGIGSGTDNTNFNWELKDMVNHYIGLLARYGLLALIPFFSFIIAVFVRLRKAYLIAQHGADQWLIWCVSSSLAGVFFAMLTVTLFDQTANLLYILLGICGSMPAIMWEASTTDHV